MEHSVSPAEMGSKIRWVSNSQAFTATRLLETFTFTFTFLFTCLAFFISFSGIPPWKLSMPTVMMDKYRAITISITSKISLYQGVSSAPDKKGLKG